MYLNYLKFYLYTSHLLRNICGVLLALILDSRFNSSCCETSDLADWKNSHGHLKRPLCCLSLLHYEDSPGV